MRGFLCCLIISFVLTTYFSCKKAELDYIPSAGLIVTNAVIGGGNIKINANQRDSAKTYNAKIFGIATGSNLITLFATNDPAKPYYTNTQSTVPGGIYSLFLGGQLSAVEAIFVKESTLINYSDSTIGIRVINLSPNSLPVNITLASDTTKNVFFKVAYKQLTDIVKLPSRSVIPSGSFTFQVRDEGNTILTTYILAASVNATYPNISTSLSRNKNLTLVIKGLKGTTTGPDAFGMFPVAYY